MNPAGMSFEPYESYVLKLCQCTALHPAEVVEILLEFAGANLLYRRARLLACCGIRRWPLDPQTLREFPNLEAQRPLLIRAYLAGACCIDDLEPVTLAHLMQRMIAKGRTERWPIPAPTTGQLNVLVGHVQSHAEHFAARRTQRRQYRPRAESGSMGVTFLARS